MDVAELDIVSRIGNSSYYTDNIVSEGFLLAGFCEDYVDAHDRHWDDAEYLFERPAWAKSDHLYGLSAECGLKALLLIEGQPIVGQYKQHIDKLWPVFKSFVNGRTRLDRLAILPSESPFKDWRIDQRYVNQRHFDEACVMAHRDATHAVRQLLHSATRDGQQ